MQESNLQGQIEANGANATKVEISQFHSPKGATSLEKEMMKLLWFAPIISNNSLCAGEVFYSQIYLKGI